MGTPDFAVGALEKIIEAGHEVVCVVTQPDKPKGRSAELVPPPVKVCATEHGIPVLQPVKLRSGEYYDQLRAYGADVFVVAAFGQILTKEVLDMPKYGCVNIHASLLPKYRGAAPIQWSILNGDEYTGVTIQQMNEGVDTGDILSVVKVKIESDDTADTLFDKLESAGAKLITECLDGLEKGTIVPVKQDESQATHVGKLSKEYGKMDFEKPATTLERMVRGLNSWPSAYTFLGGKQLKIWKAEVVDEAANCEPGAVAQVGKDYFDIQTGEGLLRVLEVQLEGKKRMPAGDFLRGVKLQINDLVK